VTTSPSTPADEVAAALEEGLAAFSARQLEAAHRAFERAHRRDPRSVRAMSWYGVTLALVEKNLNLGSSLCEQAVRTHGLDPELLLNQARVHLALHQRERAVKAVSRGLDVWPDHPALRVALEALGTRRAPVLPFLGRDNPLNRLLGQLRHRWARRHAPAYERSPVALGTGAGASALPLLPAPPPPEAQPPLALEQVVPAPSTAPAAPPSDPAASPADPGAPPDPAQAADAEPPRS
jgi:tetratricopeptide (TPR) repeat protein